MPTAYLVENRIGVDSSWAEKEQVKALPGSRWDAKNRRWSLPLSWASCCALRGTFGASLVISPDLNKWAAKERESRVDPANATRAHLEIENGQATNDPGALEIVRGWRETTDTPLHLFAYQEAGVRFLYWAHDALIADEPGTGKTATVLSLIRLLETLPEEDPYPVLVVCPNTVKRHWANQIEMWLPGATPYVLTGSLDQKRKILARARDDERAVVIINFESVRSFSRLAPYGSVALKKCQECDKQNGDPHMKSNICETHVKEFNTFGFKTCVGDEMHRVKDPKTKQTRAIWSTFHSDTITRHLALTGTPIANHPGDLWSMMHAVAPTDFPRRSSFVDRYALLSWNAFGAMDIVGLNPQTREELFRFLDPRMRRVTKDLVLTQLPPKVRTVREVEMTPSQKKAYVALERCATAELESGDLLIVANNLALTTRLLQLSSSYCDIDYGETPEDYRSWKVTLANPSPKVDELVELILELEGRSCAVVAEHRQLLELAEERLEKEGIPSVSVTGAVPEEQRARNIAAFQKGEIPVMLFTYAAGGVGIDLTAAGTLIRLQRSWSMVNVLQAEDRLHRPGSEIHESIDIIDLITTGTVEEAQIARLLQKLARLEEVNRDRARRVAAGLPLTELDLEITTIMGGTIT